MSGITQVADGTPLDASIDNTIDNNGVAKIKVVGIGGGGGNSVQHMVSQEANENVDYIVVNTDLQALKNNVVNKRIQIGRETTRGLGSGSNPEVGKKAAEESIDVIKQEIGSSDITFITAGMGGGTGTGASPVIASIVRKELGALTVAIVTKPFSFEGKKQLQKAEDGIEKLRKEVDALIVIPNDKLLRDLGGNVSLITAFNECNSVLMRAVKGLSSLITETGYMNVDFNDVKTVLTESGTALIGMGKGKGDNAVQEAINNAIHSPLLEDIRNCRCRGMLANISVSPNFPISQVNEIGNILCDLLKDDADVKYGVCMDSNAKADEVFVTILIAGIEKMEEPQVQQEIQDPFQSMGMFVESQQKSAENSDNVQQKTESSTQKAQFNNPFVDDSDDLPPFFLSKKAD
jgi:cell division protein FtsZ